MKRFLPCGAAALARIDATLASRPGPAPRAGSTPARAPALG
jgi:hypothetical protein